MSLVMESDMGVFNPLGIEFTGSSESKSLLSSLLSSLALNTNATSVVDGGDGTDIALWTDAGVPTVSLYNSNEHYFYYHHTEGDMMTVLDPDQMDRYNSFMFFYLFSYKRCAALWAVTSWAVADLDEMLPR
jgi:carboxypeptidase Q